MRRQSTGPSVSFFAFQDIITSVVGIFILITLILVVELAQRVESASTSAAADMKPVSDAIAALKQEVERMTTDVEKRIQSQTSGAELNVFNRQEKWEQAQLAAQVTTSQLATTNTKIKESKELLIAAKQETTRLLLESAALEDERTQLEQLMDKLRQVQNEINRIESSEAPIYRDVTEQGRFITLITMESNTIELRDALSKSAESWRGVRRLDDLREWMAANDLGQRQLFLILKPGSAADFEMLETDIKRSSAVYGFTVMGSDEKVQLGFEIKGLP